MAQPQLTKDEITTLLQCLHTERKSAQRAQKNGKTPQISEVYQKQDQVLAALETKLHQF